jgi:hypothetical protein
MSCDFASRTAPAVRKILPKPPEIGGLGGAFLEPLDSRFWGQTGTGNKDFLATDDWVNNLVIQWSGE